MRQLGNSQDRRAGTRLAPEIQTRGSQELQGSQRLALRCLWRRANPAMESLAGTAWLTGPPPSWPHDWQAQNCRSVKSMSPPKADMLNNPKQHGPHFTGEALESKGVLTGWCAHWVLAGFKEEKHAQAQFKKGKTSVSHPARLLPEERPQVMRWACPQL